MSWRGHLKPKFRNLMRLKNYARLLSNHCHSERSEESLAISGQGFVDQSGKQESRKRGFGILFLPSYLPGLLRFFLTRNDKRFFAALRMTALNGACPRQLPALVFNAISRL